MGHVHATLYFHLIFWGHFRLSEPHKLYRPRVSLIGLYVVAYPEKKYAGPYVILSLFIA